VLGGRQGAHRQRVHFGAHPIAKSRVHQLVARNARLAFECRADDQCFEVLAVAGHLEHAALESLRDVAPYVFGRGSHGQCRILYPEASIRKAITVTTMSAIATTARLSHGLTSD